MASYSLLSLLYILVSLVNSASCKAGVHKNETEFDFLILAHFWPPTSCYIYEENKCSAIPKSVTRWTIHGLWPSIPGPESAQPYYCNKSFPFDYNKIKSLSDQLDSEWPSYDQKEEPTFLWNHEWEKHGTCAEDFPPLSGMFNYFNRTLQLHKTLDFLGAFAKRGLYPSSNKTYDVQVFYNAILAEYKVKPTVVCYTKDGKNYFDQIYLCYNKSFVLEDCHHTGGLRSEKGGQSLRDDPYSLCPDGGLTKVLFLPMKKTREESSILYFESEIKETIEWDRE